MIEILQKFHGILKRMRFIVIVVLLFDIVHGVVVKVVFGRSRRFMMVLLLLLLRMAGLFWNCDAIGDGNIVLRMTCGDQYRRFLMR